MQWCLHVQEHVDTCAWTGTHACVLSASEQRHLKVLVQPGTWWENVWTINMANPIYDREEVFEAAHIRDAVYKRVRGKIIEVNACAYVNTCVYTSCVYMDTCMCECARMTQL
jgi:hypothetical protein